MKIMIARSTSTIDQIALPCNSCPSTGPTESKRFTSPPRALTICCRSTSLSAFVRIIKPSVPACLTTDSPILSDSSEALILSVVTVAPVVVAPTVEVATAPVLEALFIFSYLTSTIDPPLKSIPRFKPYFVIENIENPMRITEKM